MLRLYLILWLDAMRYRLLALDIDGTLLNAKNRISDATAGAIRQAVERGVLVTLCTGRSLITALSVARCLPLNAPLALNGGALIFDLLRHRALYVRNLPKNQTFEAVRIIRDLGCHPIVYSPLPDSRYFYYDAVDPTNTAFQRYVAKNPGRAHRVADVCDALSGDMAMVALTERAERMNGLGQKLRGRLPEHHVTFEISPIDPDYFHATITPTGVSKGSGLRELALLMNVDLSETIAIGDNLNDLDMLETAGLGVAMGNATPETRARAGHVTASNDEDGVARVIERFIIEN